VAAKVVLRDVYGLIRDILEMSRVHAARVTCRREMRGKVAEWERGGGSMEVAKIDVTVAHRE